MSRHEQPPPHDPGGGSPPHQLANQLFSAGLDVHQALRRVDHDAVAAGHLRSALTRLDETIASVLHTGLAHSLDDELDRLAVGTFAELAHGLAGGFDLATHLQTLTEHGTGLPDVQAAAIVLGEAGETPKLVVVAPHRSSLRELCHLRPSPVWDTCLSGQPQTVSDLDTDIRCATRRDHRPSEVVTTRPQHAQTAHFLLLENEERRLEFRGVARPEFEPFRLLSAPSCRRTQATFRPTRAVTSSPGRTVPVWITARPAAHGAVCEERRPGATSRRGARVVTSGQIEVGRELVSTQGKRNLTRVRHFAGELRARLVSWFRRIPTGETPCTDDFFLPCSRF